MGGRKYYVRSLAGVLERRVAGIVDEIGVVAGPPTMRSAAGTTVEQIVAGVAVDHVRENVAVALQVGAALQHQGLDVRRQPVVDGCKHRVVALGGILDHGVAGIIDEIRVVTDASDHGVGAAAAVDEIVAAVAEERVDEAVAEALQVGAALQHQGLDDRRQRVRGRRRTRRRCPGRRSRPRHRRHCRRSRCRCRRRRMVILSTCWRQASDLLPRLPSLVAPGAA